MKPCVNNTPLHDEQIFDNEKAGKAAYSGHSETDSGKSPLTRRHFLGGVGGVTALTVASGVIGMPSLVGSKGSVAQAAEVESSNKPSRRGRAAQIRHEAETFNKRLGTPPHPTNGDEENYQNKIANYTKGLPHDPVRGEVDLSAYNAMMNALDSGKHADFEAIPMGCAPATRRKFVNPQSGLAFDLEGADSHQFAIPPAPAFGSAQEAGEIVENYWMALLRDVPFESISTHPLANAAAADLDKLSDYRGPRDTNGHVTPGVLFRGNTPDDLNGPYISQFMFIDAPFGACFVEQQLRTTMPGVDYMTRFEDWIAVQNGCQQGSNLFESNRRYVSNGRDLGQWVHVDVLYQAYFTAYLAMTNMGVPTNAGGPYNHSNTQEGFCTFGGPYSATILCEVATRALKAVWFQK